MPPRRKKLAAVVKVQLPAGQATPAPPVGTALGPHGVNIMDFVKQYNAATESQRGNIIPVEISIFEDRTFTFVTKTPPASYFLLKAAGIEKGAQTTGRGNELGNLLRGVDVGQTAALGCAKRIRRHLVGRILGVQETG